MVWGFSVSLDCPFLIALRHSLTFINRKHYTIIARGKTTSQGWTIIMFTVSAGNNLLLYRNSIYNNVGCNKLLFVLFILCFHKLHICVLISGQDCNSGMQKRIHFRTDVEHNICGPVNNSDVSLGYQFCKNITFILYIIYNVRHNNIYSPFKVCH
jgi:hypothetical protein